MQRTQTDELENWLNSSFGGYPHSGQGDPSGITAKSMTALRGGMGQVARPTARAPQVSFPGAGLDQATSMVPTAPQRPKVPSGIGTNGGFERGQGFGGVRPLLNY